ncbi:MAG: DUF1501 domain-containing protein [Pirellulaceae bacterium]|jgi:hypothetical protein|nr:DUF1501 domain-containing protein [Pirellulaceae bacterium]MDP7020113.1 DUF1501 domain-containing protein [Pirellulaceae bacterium]
MLSLLGDSVRLCDRLPRRDFLSIGALGLGGLTLPQLLHAEATTGERSHKSVIMIYLTGGPPHQDMVDLKPDAPADIRGEFQPIATNVPGIQISELMPRCAQMMDKFAIIRTLVESDGRHSSFQCVTGRRFASQPAGGWPEMGSLLSKVRGPVDRAVPPTIDLSMKMAHLPYNLPGAGFVGKAHAPFKPSGEAMKDMVLSGVTPARLNDRKTLLKKFDDYRREFETGLPEGVSEHTKQALEILTSSKLVDALDISREDPRVRERYGKDDPKVLSYSHLGYQAHMSKFLAARRLVEAGARCVTVAFADFDWHGGNFANGRKVIPLLDRGLSALVSDLHERGMDRDVSVVVWGEFGRTPKINKNAGRDHWAPVCAAMLAGGGMTTGQAIGKTDANAERPVSRPIRFADVFATLYRNLGFDTAKATVSDLNGRPRYLTDEGRPLPELAGSL